MIFNALPKGLVVAVCCTRRASSWLVVSADELEVGLFPPSNLYASMLNAVKMAENRPACWDISPEYSAFNGHADRWKISPHTHARLKERLTKTRCVSISSFQPWIFASSWSFNAVAHSIHASAARAPRVAKVFAMGDSSSTSCHREDVSSL